MALDDGRQTPESTNGNQPNENQFDFERGYNELRPKYTQTAQELSSTRDRLSEYDAIFDALSNPDTQAEALHALGFDLNPETHADGGGKGPEEFEDPLAAELAQQREALAEVRARQDRDDAIAAQQRLEELRDDFIGSAIGMLEDSMSQDGKEFRFTEKEETTLGNLAIAMAGADKVPNVQGAYEALYGNDGLKEAWREQYIDTKLHAVVPPLGTTIPADQRPKTARERAAFIDNRITALESQQA